MLYGLIISITSLVYLIILLLIYYSKKHFDGVQGILFRYMLASCVLFILFQILLVFTVYYKMSDIFVFLALRTSWSANIAWYAFLFFYFIAFINNDSSKSFISFLKSRKICLYMAIFFAVGIILYFVLLPFDGIESLIISVEGSKTEYMNFLPGNMFYLVFVFCLGIDIIVIINLIKNIKNVKRSDRTVIYLSIFLTIFLTYLQVVHRTISTIPIGYAIEMYLLYFTIENPDLMLLKNIKKVRDEVEKSNKVKLDFLSNVSYEIKNPMESISSLTDTLLNTSVNIDSSRNYLKQICNSCSDLLDISNNVLDLSSIEAGSIALKNKNYRISNMIYKLVDITKNKLGYSKIKFNVSIDTSMPTILYGDESKLYQCLLNVLSNAVKYTEIGKINFNVTSRREGNKIRLLFKVMDTGIGIKQEDNKYLFEKFARLDDAIVNEIEGSGLGLTIVKKYLDLMGGKIWFESQHLAGSTFYIEVEQEIVDPTPINGIVFNTEKINYNCGFDCSNYKLLIVDSNDLNVEVLKRLLQRYNIVIDRIDNGDKCIEKIKAEEKYDLIFIDDNLPDISGSETLKLLMKLPDNVLPPVVVLTTNAILGMRDKYLSDGFGDYLAKPIDIQELDRIMNKYLKKS